MATQRQRLPILLALTAFAVFYALCIFSSVDTLSSEGPGLVFFDNITHQPSAGAVPASYEAAAQVKDMQPLLRVLEFNGVDPKDLPGDEPLPVRLRRAAMASEDGVNHFVVTDTTGEQRRFTLHFSKPQIGAFPGFLFLGLAYGAVGLFYLAVGLWVWARRPRDAAAPWLLALGLVAAAHLAQPAPDHVLGRQLNVLAASLLPMYAPMALGLAGAFVGVGSNVMQVQLRRFMFVVAVLLTAAIPICFEAWTRGVLGNLSFNMIMWMTGAELLSGIGIILWICRRALTSGHTPAVRRRARIFAFAAGLSFGLPALELMIFPFIEHPPLEMVVPNLVCLAAFPVTVGYAIVRYQLFDLRIVLRRGVVYAVLSLAVSLAFVGAVLLLVDAVGARAQSTAALWMTSLVLVIGVGLLQLRVQAWVEQWAHRKRDRYADAVESVSEDLVRAHTLKAATDIARRAFIDTMQLSRAYVSLVLDGKVSCVLLGSHEDPETGRVPTSLPSTFDIDTMGPVHRAYQQAQLTTAYDADALPSMEGAQPLATEFWSLYGLEVVVPLARRSEGRARIVGFVFLGPRLDGQALDDDDRNLVHTLGNQLTVAVENALAFEQIQALKDGLEDRVQQRTQALQQALADLKSAEATIVETEKQAMLGRLVAGIVHEINSPLGVVTSSADTLQRVLTRLEPELEGEGPAAKKKLVMARELVSLQQGGGQRISGLIDSLKSFVSLDEAEEKHVDVVQGIDSALQILAAELGETVNVVRCYPEAAPKVWAHGQRLNEVFLHVLHNAAKALGEGGELRITVKAEPEDRLSVCIEDTGSGIDEAEMKDLFEFGFSSKGGRMGLKLGLPTSQRTVRALGGEIRVDSVLGKGTAVHIDLPCRPGQPEALSAPPGSTAR